MCVFSFWGLRGELSVRLILSERSAGDHEDQGWLYKWRHGKECMETHTYRRAPFYVPTTPAAVLPCHLVSLDLWGCLSVNLERWGADHLCLFHRTILLPRFTITRYPDRWHCQEKKEASLPLLPAPHCRIGKNCPSPLLVVAWMRGWINPLPTFWAPWMGGWFTLALTNGWGSLQDFCSNIYTKLNPTLMLSSEQKP